MNSVSSPKFEWDATHYSGKSHAQAAWAEEVIGNLGLRSSDHVLDIGCGDGKITARLLELVPTGHVLGIDSSEAMVRFAREHFGNRSERLTFEVMDATRLTFRESFDAVFSNAVLHWIRDHRPVLRGIFNALRPGGRVCMQMGGRGNAAEVLAVMEGLRRQAEWRTFFVGFSPAYSFYGPEEYEIWIRDAGLVADRVELVSRPMSHTVEQFRGWIATTWMPYTSRIPEARRECFIAQAVDSFLAAHPQDDAGTVHVPMIRLNVSAHRSVAS